MLKTICIYSRSINRIKCKSTYIFYCNSNKQKNVNKT